MLFQLYTLQKKKKNPARNLQPIMYDSYVLFDVLQEKPLTKSLQRGEDPQFDQVRLKCPYYGNERFIFWFWESPTTG